MAGFSDTLYYTGIRFYSLGIKMAVPFSSKAARWVEGRRDLIQTIKRKRETLSDKVIWMHCASLGEFEQGRPVLEACKKAYPQKSIVLTFFSPSGYEVRKSWEGADAVFYLPADLPGAGDEFADALRPEIGLFVKYDVWPGIVKAMESRGIPMVLFAALFREGQHYFQPWGGLFREALNAFSHIILQDEKAEKLLADIAVRAKISSAPDTRFDRVLEIAAKGKAIPRIESWAGDKKVLVAGSTWQMDEIHLKLIWDEVLKPKGWKMIIATHDVSEQRRKEVGKIFPEAALWTAEGESDSDILILDTIGMLSAVYRYAHIAYVGGGFNRAIHNTLEAAVYGIPVLFGPKYKRFAEAVQLIKHEAAVSAPTGADLLQAALFLVNDSESREKVGGNAKAFVAANHGGTDHVMQVVKELLG